jgi:hypothetical protein
MKKPTYRGIRVHLSPHLPTARRKNRLAEASTRPHPRLYSLQDGKTDLQRRPRALSSALFAARRKNRLAEASSSCPILAFIHCKTKTPTYSRPPLHHSPPPCCSHPAFRSFTRPISSKLPINLAWHISLIHENQLYHFHFAARFIEAGSRT